MAENFTKGVDGAIYLAGTQQDRINSFTMTIDAPVEDVGDFGSSGPDYEYTGSKIFAGTLNGQTLRGDSVSTQPMHDIAETFSKGGTLAAVYAKFIESTKSMYHGNILLTNISKNAPGNGLQTYSANWVQSSGPLSWASTTSTS